MIPWLFVSILLAGMVILISLGLYSRRFKPRPVQLPFEILMYICAIWCATFIFDISSNSLAIKIVLMQVRYIGVSFITLTMLLIAIFFTGRGSWLTKRRLALLLLIPVTTVALVLTTRYSTLFRYNYTLVETAAGFPVLGFTNGLWSSLIYLPFNYILEAVTFILLLTVIFGNQKLYARQALLFFIAILIPVIFDILFTLGVSPVKGYNMVPSTFTLTGILMAVALFEFRFIDIVPVARTMLFEQMTDPMLVLDPGGRLADFNPAAGKLLGLNQYTDIGKIASVPLNNYSQLLECIEQQHPAPCYITTGGESGIRSFEVSIQEMRSGGGMPPAKLVLMRDITDKKRAEEALGESERKYQDLYENAQIGLFVTSFKDSTIISCNTRYAQLAGFTSVDEAIGKDVLHIYVNPEDRAEVARIFREKGSIDNYVLQLRNHSTGKIFWGMFSARFNFEREVAEGSILDITDRKEIEEALEASRVSLSDTIEKLNEAQQIALIGSWEWDLQTNNVWWSDETYRIFGVTPQDFVPGFEENGRFIHPDDFEKYGTSFEHSFQTGEPLDLDVRLVTRQGVLKYCHAQGKIIYDDAGKPARFVGTMSDITERKLAQEALRESEEKFRVIFERSTVGNSLTEPDGRLLQINQSFADMLGYSIEELQRVNFVTITYPDDLAESRECIRVLLAGEKTSYRMEKRYIHKTGRIVWADVSTTLLSDKTGTPLYLITTIQNITDRKQAEAELRQREEQFSLALEVGNAGVWKWDLRNETVSFDERFHAIFGYTAGELPATAKDWISLHHPEDQPVMLSRIEAYLQGKTPIFESEHRIRTKSGTWNWVFTRGQLVDPTTKETPGLFLGIAMNVTGRKMAQAELAAAQQQYHELFESVGIGILRSTPGPEGALIEANPAAVRIFEADSREQLLSVRPSDLYYDTDQRRKISDEIMATGFIDGMEVRYKTLKGNSIWGRINATKKISEDGQVYFDNTIEDITERKMAEQALRESEEKYREFFTTSRDCVFITSPEGRWIDFNDIAMEMFGYSDREEFAQIPIQDLYARPDERAAFIDLIGKEGYVMEYPVQLKRKDGSIIESLITVVPLLKPDGSVRAFVGTIRDVTDLKKTEDSLRETNEYLNNLINYASAPIITWDPEFRITRINHAFEHLSGRSQEEMLGKNLAILFPAGSKEDSLDLIRKTLEGERWETIEIPILNIDGSMHSVLWNTANVLDRHNNIIATIAQGIDITEQKNALDKIRWLASFPELNPSPVIEINAEGKVTFANSITRTTLESLGLPDDPLLFVPGDMNKILELLGETAETQIYREVTLGEEIFAENISINHAFQVVRIYTLNITKQKRAERERELMFADLEQKNAELERFAYTASHDLKTPLITIRGFLGFVERDAEAGDMERLHQDLTRIGNAAGKMQELLDSLLELSKIGRILGPPGPVSMKVLAEEAAELLAVPIQERDVTLTIAENLPDVYGDKKRLLEVMTNLIENGVKFMGDQQKPLIEVGVQNGSERPVFFVRDNGIGIPPEYQGRLFSLFERLEVNVPGTGVGLALVRRIIEFHGGKIWVESEGKGKGTTFWFTLPGVPEKIGVE